MSRGLIETVIKFFIKYSLYVTTTDIMWIILWDIFKRAVANVDFLLKTLLNSAFYLIDKYYDDYSVYTIIVKRPVNDYICMDK